MVRTAYLFWGISDKHWKIVIFHSKHHNKAEKSKGMSFLFDKASRTHGNLNSSRNISSISKRDLIRSRSHLSRKTLLVNGKQKIKLSAIQSTFSGFDSPCEK